MRIKHILFTVFLVLYTIFSSGCAAIWFAAGAGTAVTALAFIENDKNKSEENTDNVSEVTQEYEEDDLYIK